jgi:Domain of unknown function (DUF4148)
MKTARIAALLCLLATGSTFAQDNPSANSATGVRTAGTSPTKQQEGNWEPPYGTATGQKTRAQVYQELEQAEKDGQLTYLNRSVYAHH